MMSSKSSQAAATLCWLGGVLSLVVVQRQARAESVESLTPPRAHQAVFTPSALMQPAVSMSFDLNGPLPGLTFTPADFVQMQLVLLPGPVQAFGGLAKVRVVRATRVHAALFGGALKWQFTASNDGTIFGGGGVVTACASARCASWLSVLVGGGGATGTLDTAGSSSAGVFAGVNGLAALSTHFSLTAEVMLLGSSTWNAATAVRLDAGALSVDLGVVHLGGFEYPVLPWLAVSYRFVRST